MLYKKIKEIRTYLELSESEIAALLNISSYKYKRYENGTLEISSNDLILLSLMYNIPIDYLIFSKYKTNDIFELPAFYNLGSLNTHDKLNKLQHNLCKHCTFDCVSVNYRIIRNILNLYKNVFANNLYSIRSDKTVEIRVIAMYLQVSENDYLLYEQGKIIPSPLILANIATFFDNSIQYFFVKQKAKT